MQTIKTLKIFSLLLALATTLVAGSAEANFQLQQAPLPNPITLDDNDYLTTKGFGNVELDLVTPMGDETANFTQDGKVVIRLQDKNTGQAATIDFSTEKVADGIYEITVDSFDPGLFDLYVFTYQGPNMNGYEIEDGELTFTLRAHSLAYVLAPNNPGPNMQAATIIDPLLDFSRDGEATLMVQVNPNQLQGVPTYPGVHWDAIPADPEEEDPSEDEESAKEIDTIGDPGPTLFFSGGGCSLRAEKGNGIQDFALVLIFAAGLLLPLLRPRRS